ncbi:MAG: hypothetical protein KC657_31605, partial [Myxococcales bacterium]|nr:hypothetical protein [Myxococcales bacterium]
MTLAIRIRPRAARTAGAACVASALLVGCFSSGPTSATFTGQSPRSDAVLQVAARDLQCPLASLRVDAETRRRYLNETAFRFVVEGCAQRAGYVEACDLVGDAPPAGWVTIDGSLACRYILVTHLTLAPAPASL